jgi:YMGG-like Gly-zipper
MRRFVMISLATVCLLAGGLSVQAQQRAYRGTYQSVRQVILRLENRANLFRNSMDDWSRRTTAVQNSNDDMTGTVGDFNDSVRRLRDSFDRRQATSFEVHDFVHRNSVDMRAQNYWISIRTDLNRLANAFNLSWQASAADPSYGPDYGMQYGFQNLTGTYTVDHSRSDDARAVAERAARNLAANERTRVIDIVSRRLDPPEQLALDVRGRTVTMGSTRAAQVTFDADGRERVETSPSGRTIHSRASLSGNQLIVNSTGDRGNEFTATFQPFDNGRTLHVTRRIFLQELNQAIEVHSMYQRTSDVARFDIYNPQSATQYPSTAAGSFIIPDGARVVGILQTPLSTRTAARGDRFTLRVTEPSEFRDAMIEGRVADIARSSRLSGRSLMTLDFDNVRMRDGRTYQFAGLVETINTRNGEIARVDTEGTIRDENQTTRTEQRAAIGTAVGAIIGAIAGGGKGAAIGAILGAGAGAGSIYAEGRNDLDLDRGTEVVIRAGAPYTGPR